MASIEQLRSSVPPSAFHQALLRPAILQILRAQGYYASSPGVADTVTELACRYMEALAQSAALFAERNNEHSSDLSIVDLRMAFEDCGVFGPQREYTAEEWLGKADDTEGVDGFVRWAMGRKNQKIRKVAGVLREQNGADEGGEELGQTDYLSGTFEPPCILLFPRSWSWRL